MQHCYMKLSNIIIEKIGKEGSITFRDFMAMALYYPELGYYMGHGEKIGTDGDYYTSCMLTPAFGAMIARQLEEMCVLSDSDEFTIVEYGAGTGILCRDILNYLKANPAFYARLRYCIIEKSPAMRDKQKALLTEKVSWHHSIEEISGVNGCVISNEVLDNFPVHVVQMEQELMEVYVDFQQGQLVEVLKPASGDLKNYLKELNVELPSGYKTEINLDAVNWLENIASNLKRGYIVTIDYGFLTSELYRSSRYQGTLLCYYHHQLSNDPYKNIGEQDITAHVNFSALQHWGRKFGLSNCGFTDQGQFLITLGFRDYLASLRDQQDDIMKIVQRESFIMHTLIADMGSKIKVLVQGKDIPCSPLTGLRSLESPYPIF